MSLSASRGDVPRAPAPAARRPSRRVRFPDLGPPPGAHITNPELTFPALLWADWTDSFRCAEGPGADFDADGPPDVLPLRPETGERG